MIQEILQYKKIANGVGEMMEKTPFKKNYIIEQVGIPAPTFYRKLKSSSFTPDELLKIISILNPKEALLYELKKAEEDIKKGRVLDHNEAMNNLRKKFV